MGELAGDFGRGWASFLIMIMNRKKTLDAKEQPLGAVTDGKNTGFYLDS